ncbi:HNH homing endonuclease [Bacillus phage vB_BthS_BMBphi]|nr:HNH homing endonuclease [Bacillus phage vB_BthS_BMBphi]
MRWEVISSHPNYSINTNGDIKNNKTGKLRKLILNKHRGGYLQCNLWKNNSETMFYPHRLVATYFIREGREHEQVNHLDGNKLNNHVSNLEWVSPSENTLHAYITGLNRNKGENCNLSKLTDIQISNIIALRGKGISQQSVAKEFGIAQSYVSMLWGRKRRK